MNLLWQPELFPNEPPTVALILDKNGELYDRAYTWETGQTYANSGYQVIAVADDGYLTTEQAQERYDYELALFRDCWGRDYYFDEEED